MKFLASPFITIWENREIVNKLTKRKVESRYRASLLGTVWSILDPLLLLAVYLFVFGYIFGGSFRNDGTDSKIDYALTIFIGLSIFRLVSEVMAVGSMSVVTNVNYVKKIVFPLATLPVIDVLKAVYSFFLSMSLVTLGVQTFGNGVGVYFFWWILLLPCFFFLLCGIAWILSSLTVYFRDVNNLIQVLSIGLLFGSAVFYPISKIPSPAWSVLKFNPLLQLIETARRITIWNTAPSYEALLYLVLVSLIVFYLGFGLFTHLKKGFADVL